MESFIKKRSTYVAIYPVKNENGEVGQYVPVIKDITERKKAEQHDQLAQKVLDNLNRSSDSVTTIQNILSLTKDTTSFDTVGIRLQIGDDFPYFLQNGSSVPLQERLRWWLIIHFGLFALFFETILIPPPIESFCFSLEFKQIHRYIVKQEVDREYTLNKGIKTPLK